MSGRLHRIKDLLISGIAWTFGMSAFLLLGTTILVLSLFIHPKHFDPFIKASCRIILRCTGIRIRVEGVPHVQPHQTYLFMANHVNLFDGFVLYGYIPTYVRGVELDLHFTWSFYGLLIRRLGMIPISQTNGRSALQSLETAKATLANGTSMIILPEGGRTLDGHFKPFKRGAFRLAKEAGVDIVPVVMIGAYRINRKGTRLIRPGTMTLRFGEPIAYQDIKNAEVADLAAHVRHIMATLSQSPAIQSQAEIC